MQDIEKQALKTFSENMKYFEEKQPRIYKKLAILQQAMESGQYAQNYALEYQDGYFDVKNLKDDTWFYGMDTNEFAKQKADEINYEKMDKSLSMMYRYYYTDAMLEDFKQMSAYNSSFALVAPVEQAVMYAGGQQKMMNKIYKFAFLGIGAGVHVEAVDEKIKADTYLFVENNLELFYLSLFVTNYAKISQHAVLFFSIMDKDNEYDTVLTDFYFDIVMRNDFLKFCMLGDEYIEKMNKIQSNVVMQSHMVYPVEFLLRKGLRVSKVIKRNFKFLNISQIYKNTPLSNKKVLYIAAGPSLNNNLEWIRENQDKFTIVSVFIIADKLAKAGIKPDIFVHIDEQVRPLGRIKRYEYFKDSVFILSPSIYIEYFEKFAKKENIYLIEDRTRYKDGFGFLEIYSVGEAASMLAVILGTTNLYTIGLDLAVDQKTGKSHTEGHRGSQSDLDLQKAKDSLKGITLRKTLVPTKGNKADTVYTTPLFYASLQVIRNWNEANVTEQKIYNLSNGAYINKAMPYEIEDIKFDKTDKKVEMSSIKDFLNSISSDELSEKEKHNIVIRKQEVKRDIKLIKRFSETKIKDKEHFHKLFINMMSKTILALDPKIVEISTIFIIYLTRIAGYVGEYLNTKNADYSQKALTSVRDSVAFQLKKLLHGIGLWEFGFANPYKFFDNPDGKPYESMVFNLTLYKNQYHSRLKEVYLEESLKNDIDRKLLEGIERVPLEEKKATVGFLAIEENIVDKKYMDYLKAILETLKEPTLVAFYFEEYQKDMAKDVFSKFEKNIEYKKVNGIGDIVNGCRVFCEKFDCNGNLTLDSQCAYAIAGYPFCLNVNFVKDEECRTIEQFDNYFKLTNDIIFESLEDIGYKKEFENGERRILNCLANEQILDKIGIKNIKIDSNMLLADFIRDIVVKYALQSDEYIYEYKKVFKKFTY